MQPHPAHYLKLDGDCACGRTPVIREAVKLARGNRRVVGCKACDLDCLTRQLTGAASFEDLLQPGATYSPTIYPRDADHVRLADAYDAAQAERGDDRRAYRGAA